MKKLNFLLFLAGAALVITSCGGIKKMATVPEDVKYTVTPCPLELHAGQVEISLAGTYPEKYFNKKALLTVTPYLVDESGVEIATFESITVQGEAVEANNPVINATGGSLPAYTASVDYTDNMLKSELKVKCKVWVAGKEDAALEFPIEQKICDGVISTPALLQNTPKAILMADRFERITPETLEADIFYLINSSVVRNTELYKKDMKSFTASLTEAEKNERKEIKSAKIVAAASPDGAIDLNEKVSTGRKSSGERFLVQTMKKSKVTAASNDGFYTLEQITEDWDGFKAALEASEVQDKELILRILSMYDDPEVREKEIKNLAQVFEELKIKVLPKIRKSSLLVNIDVIGYSDEELLELIDSNPDTLNVEEMLFTATLVEDLDKKLSIYEKAAANFPEDVRPQNNVGYILIQKGDADGAKAAFVKAQGISDEAIIKNNLGVIELMAGNIEAAEELFTAAMGAGDAVNYNLGIIKVMQAEYDDATDYFGNMSDFNAALAKILNGEPEAALNTLKSIEDASAMDYYLMAVAAAQLKKEDATMTNLRSAIGKDASLKDYAKKDLEFASFFENETFKSIVN